ncbi:unnamed protein product [Albugo candida]|uniref:Uncharacterized protein n=1 Tax=Albugo candida TaxID=65357 RepID=A0A024GP31_9STRA|nr:unnamed protein product [Albugo candida]|eukprot:CCI48295.1 unnamed protein product [Albugo candida]
MSARPKSKVYFFVLNGFNHVLNKELLEGFPYGSSNRQESDSISCEPNTCYSDRDDCNGEWNPSNSGRQGFNAHWNRLESLTRTSLIWQICASKLSKDLCKLDFDTNSNPEHTKSTNNVDQCDVYDVYSFTHQSPKK